MNLSKQERIDRMKSILVMAAVFAGFLYYLISRIIELKKMRRYLKEGIRITAEILEMHCTNHKTGAESFAAHIRYEAEGREFVRMLPFEMIYENKLSLENNLVYLPGEPEKAIFYEEAKRGGASRQAFIVAFIAFVFVMLSVFFGKWD